MTPVIYRKWNYGSRPVFALFPTLPADTSGRLCTCYQHLGQHSAANYTHCIKMSRPAQPNEYADLHSDLIQIGYNDLQTVKHHKNYHKESPA